MAKRTPDETQDRIAHRGIKTATTPLRGNGASVATARCAYCRGQVSRGEERTIKVDGKTKVVHARRPRCPGERPTTDTTTEQTS